MIHNKLYLHFLLGSMQVPAVPVKIKGIEESSPVFRNKDFPFYPIPIPMSENEVQLTHHGILKYIALINKVIQLYQSQQTIRSFFSFPKAIEKLVLTSIKHEQNQFLARFDGYLSAKTGKLKILENNSDAPAGTIFTPRINSMSVRYIRENILTSNAGIEMNLSPLSFLDETIMIDKLVNCFKKKFNRLPDNLAVFQKNESVNAESSELSRLKIPGLKLDVFVVDPRDLVYSNNSIYHKTIRIDMVWNKINTVFWNELLAKDETLCTKWTDIISGNNEFIHFNPFCYRYISENKLFGALLYSPEILPFLNSDDLEIRNQFIPRSYKLIRDSEIEIDGVKHELFSYVRTHQNSLVLKECYDIRGDGVTIGIDQTSTTWALKLDEVFAKGGLVQEYIRPNQLLFIDDFNKNSLKNLNFHIDTFVFGSEILGHGAKASSNNKVNIFQGGIKVPVIVVK